MLCGSSIINTALWFLQTDRRDAGPWWQGRDSSPAASQGQSLPTKLPGPSLTSRLTAPGASSTLLGPCGPGNSLQAKEAQVLVDQSHSCTLQAIGFLRIDGQLSPGACCVTHFWGSLDPYPGPRLFPHFPEASWSRAGCGELHSAPYRGSARTLMSQGTGRLIAHLQVHSQGIAQHPAQPAPSLHTHTHTYTYKHT